MQWQIVILVVVLSTLLVGIVAFVEARRRRSARRWAALVALAVASLPVAIVLHNVFSALLGREEAVSFVVALLIAPIAFAAGTFGLAIAELGKPVRRELATALLIAGGGAALFAIYMLFALVVTILEGGNPGYQAAIEVVVVPVAALALLLGSLAAAGIAAKTPPSYAGSPR